MNYQWNQASKDTPDGPPRRRRTRAAELQIQVDRIIERCRFAVVYAGEKSAAGAVIHPTANLRPWKSYEAVAHDIAGALGRLGCKNVAVLPEDMRLGDRLRSENISMVWLNTGGVQGYDPVSHAPAMLEMLGIPYVGHAPLAAAMLDNKYVFKRLLQAADIPTAPSFVCQVGEEKFNPDTDPRFRKAFGKWAGAFVVKPISGRASLNVHYVEERCGLAEIIEIVLEATHSNVLVEGFLPGREFCVAVSGPVICRNGIVARSDGPFAFACVERVLGENEKIFTSMDISPITTDRVRIMLTGDDAPIVQKLRALGQHMFDELGLETLVRFDVRTGADGEIYVLEGNPKPDLKAPRRSVTSIICAALTHEGMCFDDLIMALLADKIDLMFAERRACADALLEMAA